MIFITRSVVFVFTINRYLMTTVNVSDGSTT
jgi:hypothetical protein